MNDKEKLKSDFLMRNGLYTVEEELTQSAYIRLPEGEKSNYIEQYSLDRGYTYQKVRMHPISTDEILEMCAIEQSNNTARSERHLKTIKNIAVFLLIMDIIGAALIIINAVLRLVIS